MRLDFKKYAIEFAVIFLSITFSFIVEEWRTNRQEKKITNEFLHRLKAELGEKTVNTKRFIDFNRESIINLEKIAVNFKTKEINDDSLFQYLIESEGMGMFDPTLETWESLKSSGVLVNIQPEIIDSVNLLLQKYKGVAAQNKFLNDMFLITWPMFVQDIPANEAVDQWIMVFQRNEYPLNGKRYQTGKRTDLNKFLNNSIAIDYYFTKVLIAGGIVEGFESLPGNEMRLIELIEKQLEE